MTALWHGRACAEDPCDYCERRAEERKEARDEPMSAGEEQERDNAYERYMDARIR